MTQVQRVEETRSARVEKETGSRPLAPDYRRIRNATMALAAPLAVEDTVVQSMPDASPTKWHLAHTTWFFETFLLGSIPGYAPHHPQFNYLFNSYYNAVGPRHCRPRRGILSRPTLDEVHSYRARVDERFVAELEAGSFDAPERRDAVVLGLHHEQQHQELILTDVKHLFGSNPLRPAYRPAPGAGTGAIAGAARAAGAPGASAWVDYPEDIRSIGFTGPGFAFDNERPRHRRLVPAFRLARDPVTNGEYLEFMKDGGYENPALWLSDGWNAVQAGGWRAPLYWEEDGVSFFTLTGVREIDPYEPVCHVSYYEADAFARWAGARLPDEAEWETAAAAATSDGHFLDDGLLHPAPVGGATAGNGGAAAPDGGPRGLLGDVWEWTRSPYTSYPGYEPPPGAFGEYNAKFMCNQLVLRGGSCATPRDHIRITYRNFFQPDARWQFMGLRLAKDVK